MSPPSLIVASYLRVLGIGDMPTMDWSTDGSGPWYVYSYKEPNDELDPNNVITVYDDTPFIDYGRMRGGRHWEHPGVNIRIRSMDQDVVGDAYQKGWQKGQAVLDALAALNSTLVAVPGDATTYRIQCYTIGQGLAFLKEEDPVKKRQLFTINGGRITLRVGGS